jgi:hypothetical protein
VSCGRMASEVNEKNLKVVVVCSTCLEGQKKTMKNPSQVTLCTSQDLYQTHPDYKSSEILLHQSAHSS